MNDINQKIQHLREYHKNPRYITKNDLNNLEDWLGQYGDLSGVVININTWEIISGNQRNRVLDLKKADLVDWVLYDEPQAAGTVAWATAIYKGERFNVRFVNWDEKTTEEAVIIANKAGGYWNMEKLINEFDSDTLLKTGWTEDELTGLFKNAEELIDSDISDEEISIEDKKPVFSIVVYFNNEEEMLDGLVLIEQAMLDNNIDGTTQIVRK